MRLWQEELAAREREIIRAETAWRTPRSISPIAARDDRQRSTFGAFVYLVPEHHVTYARAPYPYYVVDDHLHYRPSIAVGRYANEVYTTAVVAPPGGAADVVSIPTPGEVVGERMGAGIGRSIGGADGAVIGSEVGREVGGEIDAAVSRST